MERTTKLLFWLLVVIAVFGTYCFVGDVFWPLYFPSLRLHLWLGLGLIVASIPALAWHIRQTRSELMPALVIPALLLGLAGWLIPGRPEYPAFGPIGWGAYATSAQLLLMAGCAALMPAPKRAPARVSVSGIALTVILLWALHVGLFGWLLRGDERWGPMLAHSVLGIFCTVLVFPHLLWFRKFVRRKAGIPVVVAVLALLSWWWKVSYPHDLIISDIRSPMSWQQEVMPQTNALDDPDRVYGTTTANRNDRDLLDEFGPKMDPELIGDSFGCGAAGCHEIIAQQWAGSAHRFAADNLFYRKVVEQLVKDRGVDEAAFCANCHDPVRVLTGTVREAYADGAPPAGDGVGCVSCHGTVHVPIPPSNGLQTVRQPRRYPGRTTEARNNNIRLDPRAHRHDLVSNFRMAVPGVGCASCHRVVIGPDMGAAVEAAVQVAAEEPWGLERELACTDCHMPTLTIKRDFEQAMYDHHLSGVNVDLALYAWGEDIDPAALEIVRRNTERFIAGSIDLTGLSQEVRQYEIAEQTMSVLSEAGAVELSVRTAPTDGGLAIFVTTRNHRAGHPFPIGPFDLHEHWQEVVVTDATGAVLFHVGAMGEDLRVDEAAHRLGAVELDRAGNPLEHHRIWDIGGMRDKRQIPRNGSVDDSYDVPLPDGVVRPLTVRVSWQFRRANQDFVDWVFDGDGTTFPVHEMSSAEVVVP